MSMEIKQNEIMLIKNKLTQIGLSFRIRTTNIRKYRLAVFQCECGKIQIICVNRVKNSETMSCGCFRKEITAKIASKHNITHGKNKTPEHIAWAAMWGRVRGNNKLDKQNYSNRGIICCDRWKKFENFFEDMGLKPSLKHSLDRIDNNGNYCKKNCRWATRTEQSQNTRSNIYLTFKGKTQCMSAWAREVGISKGVIRSRVKLCWDVEKILTHPVQARTKKV